MANVLVTGGCGFIGRHVAAELIGAGHGVRLYDAMIEQVHGAADAGPSADIPPEAAVIRGDMRDAPRLAEALQDCDAVIHLAAEVGVGQSMYEIARYVGANDLGTAVLLEAIAAQPVQRLVVASSMSIYGEGYYALPDGRLYDGARRRKADLRAGTWQPSGPEGEALEAVPTDETKRPDLASIYALTKYQQEQAALIFGAAYDLPTVALRLFNVFGAGQALSNPYTGVLANFASRLANGERPTIFEDGQQQRDFVHVRDVARAFRLAMEAEPGAVSGETFNIGSGRSYTIERIASLLAEAMDRADLEPEVLGRFRAGDIRNCFADIGKARDRLGFAPEHRLEDSLGPFVDWVRRSPAVDRGSQMRSELEERGLVS
ncbi:NAD-dependent dehydratase/epimerase [Pseudooceanicola batsensis HTCC2597]|uniref:NAD-dependent dehydratase/epimerase n=1 Tax=Pseudooceanicola batsensis (strain ATCC BAA-863 / DSM 15984 / KCTC 12145 / HTCC2597) TaxID=252305 RepID=A3U0G7_PSEBH|nr:NAD-dependent epimerase/dehydratase family protein [Pseudooceanicola batsensis]EAQ02258.1 NAD-dependent dehydratase/epimerase [Pseudooceanicola batsensis HTCC2597]